MFSLLWFAAKKVLLKGGREEKGQLGIKDKRGGWELLEGRTDRATLQCLGRAVVVHHAAFSFVLSGEEKAAEFAHL